MAILWPLLPEKWYCKREPPPPQPTAIRYQFSHCLPFPSLWLDDVKKQEWPVIRQRAFVNRQLSHSHTFLTWSSPRNIELIQTRAKHSAPASVIHPSVFSHQGQSLNLTQGKGHLSLALSDQKFHWLLAKFNPGSMRRWERFSRCPSALSIAGFAELHLNELQTYGLHFT